MDPTDKLTDDPFGFIVIDPATGRARMEIPEPRISPARARASSDQAGLSWWQRLGLQAGIAVAPTVGRWGVNTRDAVGDAVDAVGDTVGGVVTSVRNGAVWTLVGGVVAVGAFIYLTRKG